VTPTQPQANEGAQKAREWRTRLGLGLSGPVPDVLHAVEVLAGVAVSVLELPGGVSGAYTMQEDQGFAFLNSSEPAVRQRFTLAHELGHHAFADGATIDTEDAVFGSSISPVERRARTFAAEFLVPLRAVSAWMETRDAAEVSLRTVVELACCFRVSAETALIRLRLARCLESDRVHQQLHEAVRRCEHLRLQQRLGIEEPADSLTQIKQRGGSRPPARMWEYALSGYEQGLLSVDRMAAALFSTPGAVQGVIDELGIEQAPGDPDY
jgi:Zn-dependent peptidase ImmA (M78 family)